MNTPTKDRLHLPVTPGKGCGPFQLALPVGQAIQVTQTPQFRFLSNVEFKYSDEAPFQVDIALNLPNIGILLRFEPASQKLRSIELYNFTGLKLSYQGADFSSSKVLPTCLLVYKRFGPTYPGEFDGKKSVYTLHYPGISFVFPIPEKYSSLYASGDLPLEFPDGTTPVCSRIYISSGSSSRSAVPPSLANEENVPLDDVVVTVLQGVQLHRSHGDPISVLLGVTSTQDAVTDLGPPSVVFYKREDKLRIHSSISPDGISDAPGAAGDVFLLRGDDVDDENCDYFYCYYSFGMDILFDGLRHVCRKIVLHTNLPGHIDFECYRKCRFTIHTSGKDDDYDPKKVVTADTNWDSIQEILGPPHGRPVVYDRGSRTHNPFGPTVLWGYNGIIFEVTKHGYLAAITLY